MRKPRIPTSFKELFYNIVKTMRIFWRIDRQRLVFYLMAMSSQVISGIFSLYFAGKVLTALSNVIAHHAEPRAVWIALTLAVLFQIIEQVSWRLLSYWQGSALLYWGVELNPEFHQKRLELDIQRFEDDKFNVLLNKVEADYNWKPANFAYQILNMLHAIARTIGALIVVMSFAPWLIPLIIIFSLPSLYIESLQSKVKWDMWADKSESSRAYHRVTWMFNNKHNLIEFRLFGVGSYLIEFCRKMLHDFFGAQREVMRGYIKAAVGARVVEGIFVGSIEFWLIRQVIVGRYALGQYSFYSGILQQFNNSLGLIFSTYGVLYEWNLFMTDYFKVMETPRLLSEPTHPIILDKHKIPSIELNNVSFHYPSSDQPVFNGLSLSIQPGEHIAIVGENGAGKTTLIKLLLRLYDVDKGTVKIDGHDIKLLGMDSWYQHVGVLFQDFSRYPFTVEKNIQLGRMQQPLGKAKIAQVAKQAGFDKIVASYPKGYDSILDNSFEGGIEPSGGQWQRVALARAFYRDSDILILDEPTSAIDAKAEYDIFNNIFTHYRDKTTIIVSHRFSTVRRADRIIVIDKGKIVEQGSHAKLMKQKGLYHEMFTKQAEGYR